MEGIGFKVRIFEVCLRAIGIPVLAMAAIIGVVRADLSWPR
jgi:hypothetical protein